MYFKISLKELKILLLDMGLVEDSVGLQLDKAMYLLLTIQEVPVKQVSIILLISPVGCLKKFIIEEQPRNRWKTTQSNNSHLLTSQIDIFLLSKAEGHGSLEVAQRK